MVICARFQKEEGGVGKSDLRRLGLLAAGFGDGALRVLGIPHPDSLRERFGVQDDNEPLFGKAFAFFNNALLADVLTLSFQFA